MLRKSETGQRALGAGRPDHTAGIHSKAGQQAREDRPPSGEAVAGATLKLRSSKARFGDSGTGDCRPVLTGDCRPVLEAALELGSHGFTWRGDLEKPARDGASFEVTLAGKTSLLATQHSSLLSQGGRLPGNSVNIKLLPARPSSAPAARVARPRDLDLRKGSIAAAGKDNPPVALDPYLQNMRMTGVMDSRGFVSQLDRPEEVSELTRCQTMPSDLKLHGFYLQKAEKPALAQRRAQPLPERPKLHTKFALEGAVFNSKLARFAPMRFGSNMVRLERQRTFAISRPGAGRGGSAAELALVAGAGEFVVRRLRSPTSEPMPQSVL